MEASGEEKRIEKGKQTTSRDELRCAIGFTP